MLLKFSLYFIALNLDIVKFYNIRYPLSIKWIFKSLATRKTGLIFRLVDSVVFQGWNKKIHVVNILVSFIKIFKFLYFFIKFSFTDGYRKVNRDWIDTFYPRLNYSPECKPINSYPMDPFLLVSLKLTTEHFRNSLYQNLRLRINYFQVQFYYYKLEN